VAALEPETEGDPTAILLNILTMFGSATGPSPYVAVGATRHRPLLFVVHVGATSRARKGTSHNEAERLVGMADEAWRSRISGGLSSGEGLINAVRDPVHKLSKDGDLLLVDAGVADKRLLVVEPEYSLVLRVASREGNTLSELLRRAWDGNDLRTLTKNSPLVATGPLITVLGHITADELRRELTETAQINGFANRHLFVCVRRSKLLPDGGALHNDVLTSLASDLRDALDAARKTGEVRRDDGARTLWHAVYADLTRDQPGMVGAMTARGEAIVLRLSLIYALLDRSPVIARPHLEAAIAIWNYAEASVRYIFGDATGDPIADRVLAALRRNGSMTQTAISDLFGRHVPAAKLSAALETLAASGKVTATSLETGGHPTTHWTATP
jgi:hypothetical protein